MDFETRFDKLNDAQRAAVTTTDGPVMVIAGPGTGKTELLAMRAANILRTTDTLPESILCLTFTESGSIAMKKRLAEIIGKDAYKVSVFTFHAFGTDVMSKHREYFNNGATFRPADDLARNRIITEILDALKYDDPLKSTMNGKYVAISDIISAISDLKRASLSDGEFAKLLDNCQVTIDIAGKVLTEVFSEKISKSTLDALVPALDTINAINEDASLDGTTTLQHVIASSLYAAIETAKEHPRTTPPLTAWRNEWMTHDKDANKTLVLKVQKNMPKLRALNFVYGLYLQIMKRAELYDYDDMIMDLVHAMDQNDDLRFNLQEKYQYIMVDEFQDTNLAQMRILRHLTNNPVFEGRPNILVVGDDDQAIYGFQGAEVGNILQFKDDYNETALITLKKNYRSAQPILDGARAVITQGSARLENRIPDLDKTLSSQVEDRGTVAEVTEFDTPHHERLWIAGSIKKLIDSGTAPSEIAIIARKHADLVELLSYLSEHNIPVSYDRRDNVLDDEVIVQLEHVGKIVQSMSAGRHEEANALLPMLLSHPAWGITPTTVWEISLAAREKHQQWLEVMRSFEATQPLFNWLAALSQQSLHLPLERMLDVLIGSSDIDGFHSPLKEYFFSDGSLQLNTSKYTQHLENLSVIRARLREHAVDMDSPKLAEFLDYIAENRESGASITSYRHIGEDNTAVALLSAHGSKGLEYDHVFVINATDAMWGESASSRSPSISFPPHLRLRQNTSDLEERLRLFYVAMTRARYRLSITFANENDNTKEMLPAAFLVESPLNRRIEQTEPTSASQQEAAEHLWYSPIINIPQVSVQDYLAPMLKNYKLSATHVNGFIDIVDGGPHTFLLNTMLRFPNARSAASSYGIAIHATLQYAHNHLRATSSHLPEEDILHEFEKHMSRMQFTTDEHQRYLHQGSDALRAFLREQYDTFNPAQQAELEFKHQDVRIDDVRLTGTLDMVEFDKQTRTAKVTDYKTGSVLTSWDKGQDYQKIKAHKYRQQLLFYKLLVENSRDWHDYTMTEGTLQFVEPDTAGQILNLCLRDIDDAELDRFKNLVNAVWNKIMTLDFPDTSHYDKTIAGIRQFEDDLINHII
jgi:DNA helicase II / ATP-dependent DNA helicase PcrA